MGRVVAFSKAFLAEEVGASVVEYAVGLLLVLVVTIAAITLLGAQISAAFTQIAGLV